MKQLLFLLLFPCLALAQYTGNAGQKITLGEQSTADGLVYRGLAADTTRKPSVDTMAYILLDTNTNIIWQYKKATNNAWTRVGGSISSGVTGVLPVENGGTGQSTLAAAGINTGSGTLNYLPKYTATGTTLGISSIYDNGSGVAIGTESPTNLFQFQVTGTDARFALFNNSSGDLTNFSQMAFGRGVGASEYAEFYRQNDTKRFNIYNGGGDIFFSTNFVSDYRYDLFIESDNGNVGINTASPSAKLEILGNTDSYAGMAKIFFTDSNTNSDSRNWSIGNGGSGYGNLTFSVSSVKDGNPSSGSEINAMVIDKSGNVGIGTTSPAVQFHTTSNVRFAGLTSITDLRTDADGDLFNGSDFNLKNSIDTINFGLLDVLKLKPVSFNWNNESRNINEYKSMGFIAQDVMNVIPNAASTMGDGDMQVDYNAIVATLTKAIQEQQALIKALEQRILILENK